MPGCTACRKRIQHIPDDQTGAMHRLELRGGFAHNHFFLRKQLENVFRYRCRSRHAVHILEHASPAVIVDQRARLALIGRQPLGNHLFAVIGALHELAAITVTTARHLGRVIVYIINLPANCARAASGKPPDQLILVDDEMDDQRLHLARAPQNFVQPFAPAAASAESHPA